MTGATVTAHVLTDDEARSLLAVGATAEDVVRLGFPDADAEFAGFLLWEKTPFPLVQGVHDLADAVAQLVIDGPRCDEYHRHGMCRRKVAEWGARCWQHATSEEVAS